ncbi:hypothetical protein [Microbulbifer sp. YPW16]|uniref:hypothetical protein n=1 Tax=unclassified Microbulbifer TaxID=2619833 RepID=UPI001E314FCA|nr:hypothetical protein [Microbulbifer sp. YPW16]UHQ54585.1 hypothetical protein LVE68_13905 [Microbulbifer sp. YPW16]
MRKAISFVTILSLSFVSHANSGIEGSWELEGNSDRYFFGINIAKSGDHFTGTYCAVAQGGLKMDCGIDEEKEFLIKEVSCAKYELEFESHFSESKGRASLSLQEGILTWSLLSAPKGEHYVPTEARLHASSGT